MSFKTGLGYDIHRLVKGRKLILGGVDIPYEKGLDGHSDADVLIHAVCDALLGALGKGDIGEHFPNTDDRYKNISSMVLLKEVKALLDAESFGVVNMDTIIIAEEPNMKKFKSEIRKNLAVVLDMDEQKINVKAKTQEGLGPIGNSEAIAAYSTVLLEKF